MEMRWENLTAVDFAAAVTRAGGTCIIPLGVVEKHGEHLPLGTDVFIARAVAEAAVKTEPCVIFPAYYLMQIHEAKHQPGTIAIDFRLMFDLLENCCREIARNGMKKIVLLNGHGGNSGFLHCFADFMLERPRDYTLYIIGLVDYRVEDNDPVWQSMQKTSFDYHAGEHETSMALSVCPQLVKMNAIRNDGMPMKRSDEVKGLKNSITWYAEFPNHYAGDARPATAEKGKYLLEKSASKVVDLLRKVKRDEVLPGLIREFWDRAGKPLK